jgi:hypothetical protein
MVRVREEGKKKKRELLECHKGVHDVFLKRK